VGILFSLLSLFMFASVSGSSASTPLDAWLYASKADVGGPGLVAAREAGLAATHSKSAPVEARLVLEAAHLTVYWTRQEFVAVPNPASAHGEPLTHLAKGSAASGERSYDGVRVAAASWDPDANWMVLPGPRGNSTLTMGFASLDLVSAHHASWQAGNPVAAGVQVLPSPPLRIDHAIPDGVPLARVPNGHGAQAEGDFWLYLWGLNATVVDAAGGGETWPSGTWSDNRTGSAVDPRGASGDAQSQFVFMHAEGARLVVSQASGDLFAYARALDVTGREARFDDASGRVEAGADAVTVTNESVAWTGDLRLHVERSDGGGGPYAVEAGGSVSAASVGGQDLRLDPLSNVSRKAFPRVAIALSWILILGGVLAGLGWYWRRRPAVDPYVGVEAALLKRRPRAARRRLRRILSKRPEEGHAWFLLGATWLMEGAPQRVIEEIEPAARRARGTDHEAPAFVLALAFARLRQQEPAFEWLRKAARDPALRRRAATEPDFHALRRDPRFGRLVDSEAAAYG